MLYELSYTGPEKFIKMFNFDRRFSKGNFDNICINCKPYHSEFLYFQTVKEYFLNIYELCSKSSLYQILMENLFL